MIQMELYIRWKWVRVYSEVRLYQVLYVLATSVVLVEKTYSTRTDIKRLVSF